MKKNIYKKYIKKNYFSFCLNTLSGRYEEITRNLNTVK